MDKWDELRQSIRELYENNLDDKPNVAQVMRYLLKLMSVMEAGEK